ncbi:MAG TPA: hypothetical protein VL400_01310 [Polyangiaceae bacterium]|nr:hypothetical protein [Polyangiaceae bacterium]
MRARALIVPALALAACSDDPTEESAPSAPDAAEKVGSTEQAVVGNIEPGAIQIDGPTAGADLFANVGTPLNAGAALDWVADSNANSGTNCLGSDGIAKCIETGVTGAAGGTGHWNGLRIVDGIGGADQDIFLTGGKENDTSTWNIGPGSVGSSKYDMTQAYLANNQSSLFFGMERRGNNGTTAFDFEFDQLAPMALQSCPQNAQIPCRSDGDVLFTFEMQGSGGSGSATAHIFTWDGTTFVEGSASGILSSINDSTATAGGPWGHVDAQGNWVLGDLSRFSFAESVAPISVLPGVNQCGGKAYVQVRTRSSSTATSDLKDTSKVFEFQFNSASATASLSPSCDQGFNYTASGVGVDGKPIANPTCHWTFSDGSTSDLCSGFKSAAPGSYTGSVEVTDPAAPGCAGTKETGSVSVYAPISVVADLTATCSSTFTYDATASGGSNAAGASYAWAFSGGPTTPSSSTTKSGSVTVGTPGISYTGLVVATDPRTDITCTASASDSATPYAPLAVDLALAAAAQSCPGMTSDSVTYDASPSGGNGSYTYTWIGPSCSGSSCTIDPSDGTFCTSQTVAVKLSDSSGLCSDVTSETETYGKTTTVTASNLP